MVDKARSGVGATTMQKAAAAVGAVFVLVGILGFVPGITSNFDSIEFAGHESDAKLLGIFEVSVLHNLVPCSSASPGLPWPDVGSHPVPT